MCPVKNIDGLNKVSKYMTKNEDIDSASGGEFNNIGVGHILLFAD